MLKTGFRTDAGEIGIFINHSLKQLEFKNESKKRRYHFSLVYTASLAGFNHFLKTLLEYNKSSTMDQHVFCRCNKINEKNLKEVIPLLAKYGFTNIILEDVDNHTYNVIYAAQKKGKTFKFLLKPSNMMHQEFLTILASSDPLVGLTGDQSYGEGISFTDKIIIYEARVHKEDFYNGIIEFAKGKISADSLQALRLLAYANTEEDYQLLGNLLQDQTVVAQLNALSNSMIEFSHLETEIISFVKNYLSSDESKIQLSVSSQSSFFKAQNINNSSDIKGFISNLKDYIEMRLREPDHFFGYTRAEKINEANNLIDLLEEKITTEMFYANEKNLKILQERNSRLKDISGAAIEYVNRKYSHMEKKLERK